MAQVNIRDIVEYPTFRKNPGPLLNQATEGRTLLLLKGRERIVIMDAETYEDLVNRAARLEQYERRDAVGDQRTGTEG
jgi:PHD/YefM family antitoxin component YafN of YafNO toxin-antitoxin module